MLRALSLLTLLVGLAIFPGCGESSVTDDGGTDDRVTLVSQSSDCSGSICTAPYERCVTLAADPTVVAASITLTGVSLGSGTIGAGGTEFCASACWCFSPDSNLLMVETADATYSIDVGGGPCCG